MFRPARFTNLGWLSLAIALAACGGSEDDGGGQDGDGDDGTAADGGGQTPDAGEAAGLRCDTHSWCTTYGATDEPVVDPPDLTGGAIPDGVYRLEQGTFGAEAYAFEGDTVVSIGSLYQNRIGTYSTSGGTLNLSFTAFCTHEGEEADDFDTSYSFAVAGDDLYLRYEENPVHRFTRVTALCETDAYFDCNVTNCACVAGVGQGLGEPTGDPVDQCGG
jgi:hypothetical protein